MEKGIEEKLAEARAKRAELENGRAMAPVDLEAELERELRTTADLEALNAAETKHGKISAPAPKIAAITTELGLVIVKRADVTLFRKFMDQESTSLAVTETLVVPCVIYPTKDAFERMQREQPAILVDVAQAVMRLAGVRQKSVMGKA